MIKIYKEQLKAYFILTELSFVLMMLVSFCILRFLVLDYKGDINDTFFVFFATLIIGTLVILVWSSIIALFPAKTKTYVKILQVAIGYTIAAITLGHLDTTNKMGLDPGTLSFFFLFLIFIQIIFGKLISIDGENDTERKKDS
jgi:hypothetical protein